MPRSLYFIALLLIGLTGCQSESDPHLGTWWRINENGDSTMITMDQEQYYTLQVRESIMLGKGIRLFGEEPTDTKYAIDYTTDPITLSLFEHRNGEQSSMGTGIVHFVDDNTMYLELGNGNDDVTSTFSPDQLDSINLFRRKS